jgi:hypothetical protein
MLFTRYDYGGQIKVDEMRRAYSMHSGDERYTHITSVRILEGKKLHGKPRPRFQDYIKIDFEGT